MAIKNRWTILLPAKAKSEATKKQSLDPILQVQINSGVIKEVSCNQSTFNNLKALHGNLGEGEIECLSIANDCQNNKTTNYLILSDDKKAMNRAKHYHIHAADILVFLALANHQGVISKEKVIRYIDSLKKHSYIANATRLRSLLQSLV